MGIIICEKHGRAGIVTGILKEICQKILNDEYINQNELTTIQIDYYDEDVLLLTDKFLVTTMLKKELYLMDNYKIYTDEDEDKFLSLIESRLGVICGKCYREYILKHNIKIDFK